MLLLEQQGDFIEKYVTPLLMACPFCKMDWYSLRIEYNHQEIIEYRCAACSKRFEFYKTFGKIVERGRDTDSAT